MRVFLMVATALLVGCGSGGVVDRLNGKTPLREARMMEDTRSGDNRRDAIIWLMQTSYGRHEPYTKRYRQIASSDSDPLVRAAAIRALNASRDVQATSVFVAALRDSDAMVRWQAAKALANVPDNSAAAPLMQSLANLQETQNVRIAVADALRHYRSPEVAKALISALNLKDFGISWQSRQSLRTITGKDFRYNENAWSQFVTDNTAKAAS